MSTSDASPVSRIGGQNEYFHQLSLLLLASDEVLEGEAAPGLVLQTGRVGNGKVARDRRHSSRHASGLQGFAAPCGQAWGRALGDWAAAAVAAEQDRVQREFGGEKIFCRGNFLRIPIFWQGAKLYTRQMSKAVSRGNLAAFLRLSLLPCLGAAAALEYRATGSDKGVW